LAESAGPAGVGPLGAVADGLDVLKVVGCKRAIIDEQQRWSERDVHVGIGEGTRVTATVVDDAELGSACVVSVLEEFFD
jgi:hypothetical protein